MYKQLIIHEYTHYAFHQKTRQLGRIRLYFRFGFMRG